MNFSLNDFIKFSLLEDIGDGDFSTLSTIPADAVGKAALHIKEPCIIAGIDLAEQVYAIYDPSLKFKKLKQDGEKASAGEIAYFIEGNIRSILSTERVILNCLQRMSGIATKTHKLAQKIKHTSTKILDTRKTTPLNRYIEKWAVRIGGGYNHRMGLYDMIMIKDNHIDFAGGIESAIDRCTEFLKKNNLTLPIVIEARNFEEINAILRTGKINRILLDNFQPETLRKAVTLIAHRVETEASGGITEENIVEYAETGVDYISVGELTHHIKSIDLSLKAVKE